MARRMPSPGAPDKAATHGSEKRRDTGGAGTTGVVRKPGARRGRRMPAADIVEFFSRLRELDPEPRTELEHSSPYELLVAVTLSAQATDSGVNKATRRLFPVANTPEQVAALGVEGLKPYIASIGLFNTKAANVVAAARMLVDQHGGQVPRDRVALEALPGVGRKTANVVLNTAFGEPTMAVDTHIFRVANRTGLAPGDNVREVEDALLRRVPGEFLRDAHHWLILHGRYTCKARRPECPRCPVRDLCRYPDKTPGLPE
jgi:endonuclease III